MKKLPLLCLVIAAQTNFGTLPSLAEPASGTSFSATTAAAAEAHSGGQKSSEQKSGATRQTDSARSESPEEEGQLPKNYGRSSTLLSTSQCKINCTAPQAACSESAQVLSIVQQIYKALSERDFDAVSKYIDENCTKFDQATGKLIVGRKAILEDLKDQLEKVGPGSKMPLLSFTIDHPYAHVAGDNAVVTFTAFKELGGEHPKKFESHCTDIFKREGSSWMKISYRRNWKEINL